MSGAELALATVAAAEGCLMAAEAVWKMIKAVKRADFELTESLVKLEAGCLRVKRQVQIVGKREIAETLEPELLDNCSYCLKILDAKFALLNKLLESVVSSPSTPAPGSVTAKKVKYAWNKKKIEKAVQEFMSWQSCWNQNFCLLFWTQNPNIDRVLASSKVRDKFPMAQVIRDERNRQLDDSLDQLRSAEDFKGTFHGVVAFTNFSIARQTQWPLARPHIIEPCVIPCTSMSPALVEEVKIQMCKISARLRHLESLEASLLQSKGVIFTEPAREGKSATFSLVFRYPRNLSENLSSLRGRLLSAPPTSLSHRFDIARNVADAVNYVHTFGFVHKNIRPETILVADTEGAIRKPSAFLLGFGSIREDEAKTFGQGDEDWEKNLYRHRRRRGEKPLDKYIMQHDIYSLGVCLLEIGLWSSLVEYTAGDSDEEIIPTPSQLLIPSGSNDIDMASQDSIEDHLLALAKQRLPQVMGTQYAEIAQLCLTCTTDTTSELGDPTQSAAVDGVKTGARFIGNVLLQLAEICV